MRINYTNNTIELNKTESKKAANVGTEEYKKLIDARRAFPNYTICVISSGAKRSRGIRGLTYEYMEGYICKNGATEQLEKFKELRDGAFDLDDTKKSYGIIRKWFLNEFPEIMEFVKKKDDISNLKKAV